MKKQGVIRQRLMQEEDMSGMLCWSIGSGIIQNGVLLMNCAIRQNIVEYHH